MELLQQRGIPYVEYTFDDWREDVKTIDQLWPEIEKSAKDPEQIAPRSVLRGFLKRLKARP